jgi:hypothetical protein
MAEDYPKRRFSGVGFMVKVGLEPYSKDQFMRREVAS